MIVWISTVAAILLSSPAAGLFSASVGQDVEGESRQIIAYITNSSRYSKDERPQTDTGDPLTVTFKAYIYFLKANSSNTKDMDTRVLMELTWHDSRLQFPDSNLSSVYGEDWLLDRLWYPRVFLSYADDGGVSGYREKDERVVVESSGLVLLTMRLKVTLMCSASKSYRYPFDSKQCNLGLSSSWLNSTDLLFKWANDTPVSYSSDISPVSFSLDEITINSTEVSELEIEACDYCSSGHSTLIISFHFKRRFAYHLMEYYLPCCLLVMMSWLTFWLNPNESPGRVIVGTGAILNLLEFVLDDDEQQSRVEYIWALSCFVFIFLAFIEFAFVNTIDRRGSERVVLKKNASKYIIQYSVSPSPKRSLSRRRRSSTVPSSPQIRRLFADGRPKSKIIEELRNENFLSEVNKRVTALADEIKEQENSSTAEASGFFTMTPQDVAKWIDTKSRFAFPLGFALFNLIYWSFLYIPEGWFAF